MSDIKPLMSAQQFRDFTGLNINRIYRLMEDGTLPVFADGGKGQTGEKLIVTRLALRNIDRAALEDAKKSRERSAR